MILYLFHLIVFIYLFMCLFVQLVREVIICRHIYLFIYLFICAIISQFFCLYVFFFTFIWIYYYKMYAVSFPVKLSFY